MSRIYNITMILKGADLLGLKIISAKDKKELGKIEDIVYDPKKNKVIALLVSKGDILAEPNVIPFPEIKEITMEAVFVKSEQSIKPGSKVIKPASTAEDTDTYMKDTKIVNEEGKQLGKERDILFDTKTGQVQQFEVMQGNQLQQVKVSTVVSSTDSATIIKEGESPKAPQEGIMDKLKHAMGE